MISLSPSDSGASQPSNTKPVNALALTFLGAPGGSMVRIWRIATLPMDSPSSVAVTSTVSSASLTSSAMDVTVAATSLSPFSSVSV